MLYEVITSMPEWWKKIKNNFPVVLINQGTISVNLDDLCKPAIEALKNEKLNVIAVPVNHGEIPDIPQNTHTEPFIPFEHLLPHVRNNFV